MGDIPSSLSTNFAAALKRPATEGFSSLTLPLIDIMVLPRRNDKGRSDPRSTVQRHDIGKCRCETDEVSSSRRGQASWSGTVSSLCEHDRGSGQDASSLSPNGSRMGLSKDFARPGHSLDPRECGGADHVVVVTPHHLASAAWTAKGASKSRVRIRAALSRTGSKVEFSPPLFHHHNHPLPHRNSTLEVDDEVLLAVADNDPKAVEQQPGKRGLDKSHHRGGQQLAEGRAERPAAHNAAPALSVASYTHQRTPAAAT
jgi:hypothetical protein